MAEECGHKTVHQRLIEERLSAAGQLVHVLQKSKQQLNIRKIMADDASIASIVDGISPMEIWIGDAVGHIWIRLLHARLIVYGCLVGSYGGGVVCGCQCDCYYLLEKC